VQPSGAAGAAVTFLEESAAEEELPLELQAISTTAPQSKTRIAFFIFL
jgi:hypothetical protein